MTMIIAALIGVGSLFLAWDLYERYRRQRYRRDKRAKTRTLERDWWVTSWLYGAQRTKRLTYRDPNERRD